jgi:organic hydroperoxide reductase OsmC/OhrA
MDIGPDGGREHRYRFTLEWTGNQGSGTSNYRAYGRDHIVRAPGKPDLPGSSDPAFRGDPARWTPEELLVVSLAQCHLLWYLHLCARDRVVVTTYRDDPIGVMEENQDGSGQFVSVTLRPTVEVADASMVEAAELLHGEVDRWCFIARSVNFPVLHQPRISAPVQP